MKKQSITYGEFDITIENSGAIAINCNNKKVGRGQVKATLLDIAHLAAFPVDNKLNTRQLGKKVFKYLQSNKGLPVIIPPQKQKLKNIMKSGRNCLFM